MLDVDVFDTENSDVLMKFSSLELSEFFFELFIESQAQSLATNMATTIEQSVFMMAGRLLAVLWLSKRDKLQQ
ncbi:hypothetical protein HF325_005109 [Metschnikowia pulcherrima]|uniref:Uncharacterized protein n=1 Tax=Metschnikowia pulcherrima TaxID=27326 RepID=A0A8H7LA92_9ASCO|nr:hypothetical protein HF325_005109 [Metschnikowia pulcherrima]